MPKVTLPHINSGYLSTDALNAIIDAIEAAFENTLSRDGTAPNQLQVDLDLNGGKLLNTAPAVADTDVPTYGQVKGLGPGFVVQDQETQVPGVNTSVFTLTTVSYEPGSQNLAVYVDGLRKFSGFDYTETDSTTVTFAAPITAGQRVVFVVNEFLATIDITSPPSVQWSTLVGVPEFASRWPDWTEVTGKPTTFTPAAHNQDASTITTGRLADPRRGVFVQASTPTATTVGDLWFW